jgi:hypothetical protein
VEALVNNTTTSTVHFYYNNNPIPASGGTATVVGNGKAKLTFSSGSTVETSSGGSRYGGTMTYGRTYSMTNGNGFTINTTNGSVTAANRGTTVGAVRTSNVITGEFIATFTHPASMGSTKVKDSIRGTQTVSQQANQITAYGNPTGGSLTVNDIPASGGTISSGTIGGTVSQTRTYTSGSNDTYSQATPTNGTYSAGISGSNLGTTVTSRTAKGTLTYSYTLNGKSGSIFATVYQQANTWVDNRMTLSVSSTSIGASGGTVTLHTVVYRMYASGTEGLSGKGLITSWSGSATGFTLSGFNLTAANRGTTVGAARSITLTATYAHLTSNSVTVTQAANSLTWNNPVITFSYPGDIPASGGTITPTVSITQSGSYSSGSPASNTTIASKSFSGTGVNASTGAYTASSLGTTVKPRTNLVTATVTVTANGKTGTKSADVYQAQNRLLNGDLNGSNSDFKATCTLLANQLTAAGGTATFGGSASHTHRYYTQYDSGTYGPYTKTVTDGISLSMVGNGNSRFSFANSVATHSNMGKNVTTDTVTIRCTNSANTSTHHDASASISNAVTGYNAPTIGAFTYPAGSISYSGGSQSPSYSIYQNLTYTSGTSALTRVDDNWYGGNNYSKGFSITGTGFSINYSTGVVTAASNSSTSTRSATVTMSINGRTSVILDKATATVTQAAKPGPQRVDISINDPRLAGGEVVLTFSPACYDNITVLVMGYTQDGSIFSEYRQVGGGITEDRFYPNGAWADSASIENIDGEGIPPVTKSNGIYYW